MSAFLTWIVNIILNWLAELVTREIQQAHDKVVLDQQRGKIDTANIKAHEEAQTRAEKIKTAQDLINGVHTP